ncbi:hypothetical protein AVEN_104633-1 [Araneus ventricosus]|uniref:Uncharacterized protein n=1 Tax=Araneus ventricosus TaxID=182803 RepID=A0A4Y2BDU6_ARAVE|nr:hypothetical protein AVEN_104633-1 [Araneus ventricosus]
MAASPGALISPLPSPKIPPLEILSPPLFKPRTKSTSVFFSQRKSPLFYVTGSHVTSITPLILFGHSHHKNPLFSIPLLNLLESSEQVEISSVTAGISSAIGISLLSATKQFSQGTMLRGVTTIHHSFRKLSGAGSQKGAHYIF